MLVKFCKPQYNLLDRCCTIRLGTFSYYRNMNPEFTIADSTEGVETVEVASLPSGKASPEAAAAMAHGPLRVGPYSEVTNCELTTILPDCYVWCCSECKESPTDDWGKRFDNDYTSFYTIPNPQRFAEHLMFLLMHNVYRDTFDDSAQKVFDTFTIADMGNIELLISHHKVMYVDTKVSTINDGFFQTYAPTIPPPLRPVFAKPIQYSKDREYRFAFMFQHRQHGLLPVRSAPLDLPAIPIASGIIHPP